MFCPQCGSSQSEEVKFCKSCGANLFAVRQVVQTRETDEKMDWSKTWVAEIFLSEDEKRKRKRELERQLGITPEVKRQNEIKGGIITSCAGLGLMIFLFVLMKGLVAGLDLPRIAVEILSRVWVVGVIPFFVGLGLVINGLLVGKKGNAMHEQQAFERDKERPALRSADTAEFIPSGFSVTEGTTKHLNVTGQKPSDTNT
jgi:hypothetical protein